jgi:hypothetical protein
MQTQAILYRYAENLVCNVFYADFFKPEIVIVEVMLSVLKQIL